MRCKTGVAESQLPNPRLKWETTTEFNIGLDWGVLQKPFDRFYRILSKKQFQIC